ncbi:MAG: hypothetical protein Q8N18_26305 [Opitutaceae bacterium]|nr:hypothetical protein [Opitutaceae bacterium]
MSTLREELAERRATQTAEAAFVVASAPVATLVVSIWEGDTWVLPWAQFANAKLGGSTRLELSFPNHVVVIQGRKLRALLPDLAAFRVSSVRDFPPDYRPPGEAGQPFITRIEVRPRSGAAEIREPSQ